ncbi:beta-1,3-galactosyltransferase 1-like [Ornithodoros turicata]|uniref:beta-1,3-galactosyltransferase 1-like n=1 Tax=Ornithodoros turicata TaxID=34597 RepID=UPI003138DDA8
MLRLRWIQRSMLRGYHFAQAVCILLLSLYVLLLLLNPSETERQSPAFSSYQSRASPVQQLGKSDGETENHSVVPPNIVFCARCVPPTIKTLVYRRPQGLDIDEDDTALRHNPVLLLTQVRKRDPKDNVVVCVTSSPNNFEARKAIRHSWGNATQNLTVLFFMGRPRDFYILKRVKDESSRHEDIIMENLTPRARNRVLHAIQALLIARRLFDNRSNVLKVYDNTFVNTRLLLGITRGFSVPPDQLYGRISFTGGTAHLQDCAYLFRASTITTLCRAMADVPMDFREGVYITGMLAKEANVSLVNTHLIGSCTGGAMEVDICSIRSRLTVHPVTPKNHYDYHRAVTRDVKCVPSGQRQRGRTAGG